MKASKIAVAIICHHTSSVTCHLYKYLYIYIQIGFLCMATSCHLQNLPRGHWGYHFFNAVSFRARGGTWPVLHRWAGLLDDKKVMGSLKIEKHMIIEWHIWNWIFFVVKKKSTYINVVIEKLWILQNSEKEIWCTQIVKKHPFVIDTVLILRWSHMSRKSGSKSCQSFHLQRI